MSLQAQIVLNPTYQILSMCREIKEEPGNKLERTYHINWNNKILNVLRNAKPYNNDIKKINHNVILELYTDYEYMFGPFVDTNKEEFNLVYLLYTNRINSSNDLKVLYANRVLIEENKQQILPYENYFRDAKGYLKATETKPIIHNKLSYNCYYRIYTLSEEEKKEALRIYDAKSISNEFRYNSLREMFNINITTDNRINTTINAFRLLCEIHKIKRRLTESEVAFPINGRKGDLNLDNVGYRNIAEEKKKTRENAKEIYGLDVDKLEFLMRPTGYSRFRGIYLHNEGTNVGSNMNRRYVKMIKPGTDKQTVLFLSRALMIVKMNRLLKTYEEVDHIDNDRTNDNIANLRLVTKVENVVDDSVKVEIDPVPCVICGTEVSLNRKQYEFYKKSHYVVMCCDSCKAKLYSLPKEKQKELKEKQPITFRYFVLDKFTRERKYFKSKDYKECRIMLAKDKANAFIN